MNLDKIGFKIGFVVSDYKTRYKAIF